MEYMSIEFLWLFTDFSTHVYCQAWNESKGCEELQLAHQKMKHEVVSQENHSREHARLESEAKAMEESVRTELQMTSSELASANKALQAKQDHVESEASTSPVSFKDRVFRATEASGMARLRAEKTETQPDSLKATMAALKLRAMAKSKIEAAAPAEAAAAPPAKSPAVLAAHRAKALGVSKKQLQRPVAVLRDTAKDC